LLFYCFHRINKKKFLISNESLEERNNWMSTHKSTYYFLIAFSLAMLVLQLFYMPLRTAIVFVPVALLGIGYTFSVIPTPKGWKRLRDIYWLKTFWIAFAFSWLTTFLPVVFAEPITSLQKPEVLFIFIRSLLFLFAISMPFDIRDVEFDKLKNVNTLPVVIGINASIYIVMALLLVFVLLVGVDVFYFNLTLRLAVALIISAIITMLLMPLVKTKRPSLFFPLVYDSAMLVQWLLVVALIRL
jgi:4-hydroxybenzoate polyprenyltransferase